MIGFVSGCFGASFIGWTVLRVALSVELLAASRTDARFIVYFSASTSDSYGYLAIVAMYAPSLLVARIR